jgi:allophanate hydrolase
MSDGPADISLDFHSLRARYDSGELGPTALVRALQPRLESSVERHVWIHLSSKKELISAAEELEWRKTRGDVLPLYGLPFAVKDNIDVRGVPTTAACAEFAYIPDHSAFVVDRLLEAGALFVGKTNLDQFATGLVGVRSPYGTPVNPFDPTRIPGGSSSGSGVSVSSGLVSFALGTDTAGSGRVPAGLNNIVGLKPSRGLLSNRGMVPACASLDCMSVFALTVDDAADVARIAVAYDPDDPYSRLEARRASFAPGALAGTFRFGTPDPEYLGELEAAGAMPAFDVALARLARLGGERVAVDLSAFYATSSLLYDGPWIAERRTSMREIYADNPSALLPVLREILSRADRFDAMATFDAMHHLAELSARARREWRSMDVLVVPTALFFPTLAEVEKDPIWINTRLGALTNFVNLLDLCALAVPSDFGAQRLPFGITLIGPRDADAWLATLGAAFQRDVGGKLGATTFAQPPARPRPAQKTGSVRLAVVGAHLSGQPLNGQLTELGAELVHSGKTAPDYRLYALSGTVPPKPGLVRVGAGRGVAVEIEVWELSTPAFGQFTSLVPAPLCIGSVTLDDGDAVRGFLCEPYALEGARDISDYGGWRAYLMRRDSQP